MATTAKKNTARKPVAKKAKAAAAKRQNVKNVGVKCRNCKKHPAKRRGLCSGAGSNGCYRKELRAERAASK